MNEDGVVKQLLESKQMFLPFHQQTVEHLDVQAFETRSQMGIMAGLNAAKHIKQLLAEKQHIRLIFAAAPSQNEFLETLSLQESIDWSRITVFHMDEYIGLTDDAPQKFSRFLQGKLFDLIQPKVFHLINSSNDPSAECRRYSLLLNEAPIDVVFLGIGENGHIAFNDPPTADFHDPLSVKIVELDDSCRNQQVNDGCFTAIADVPTHAMTLTIPALMSAQSLFCMVPGERKRQAVEHMLQGPISTDCPASILRTHPNCTLYLDKDSSVQGWIKD